jgi:hypothetical protein
MVNSSDVSGKNLIGSGLAQVFDNTNLVNAFDYARQRRIQAANLLLEKRNDDLATLNSIKEITPSKWEYSNKSEIYKEINDLYNKYLDKFQKDKTLSYQDKLNLQSEAIRLKNNIGQLNAIGDMIKAYSTQLNSMKDSEVDKTKAKRILDVFHYDSIDKYIEAKKNSTNEEEKAFAEDLEKDWNSSNKKLTDFLQNYKDKYFNIERQFDLVKALREIARDAGVDKNFRISEIKDGKYKIETDESNLNKVKDIALSKYNAGGDFKSNIDSIYNGLDDNIKNKYKNARDYLDKAIEPFATDKKNVHITGSSTKNKSEFKKIEGGWGNDKDGILIHEPTNSETSKITGQENVPTIKINETSKYVKNITIPSKRYIVVEDGDVEFKEIKSNLTIHPIGFQKFNITNKDDIKKANAAGMYVMGNQWYIIGKYEESNAYGGKDVKTVYIPLGNLNAKNNFDYVAEGLNIDRKTFKEIIKEGDNLESNNDKKNTYKNIIY